MSVDTAIQKVFQTDQQYAMFSYNDVKYFASFIDYSNDIAEDTLYRILARAGPWDQTSLESIRRWRTVYSLLGSHVITEVQYGSRLSLVSLIITVETFKISPNTAH